MINLLGEQEVVMDKVPGGPNFEPRLIVGLNVALATIASTVAAVIGQPAVALPICGMVGTVYGVSSVIRSIQKPGQ